MNVTVSALSIYFLFNARDQENSRIGAKKQQNQFRALCAGLVVSLFYDIIWSFMKDSAEGQLQTEHVMFELVSWVQTIMMIFKVFMCFVFWKASLDFAALIDSRSELFN